MLLVEKRMRLICLRGIPKPYLEETLLNFAQILQIVSFPWFQVRQHSKADLSCPLCWSRYFSARTWHWLVRISGQDSSPAFPYILTRSLHVVQYTTLSSSIVWAGNIFRKLVKYQCLKAASTFWRSLVSSLLGFFNLFGFPVLLV